MNAFQFSGTVVSWQQMQFNGNPCLTVTATETISGDTYTLVTTNPKTIEVVLEIIENNQDFEVAGYLSPQRSGSVELVIGQYKAIGY